MIRVLTAGAALVALGAAGGYLVAGGGASGTRAELDLPARYQAAWPAVVTVKTDVARLDPLESRGIGTAFHVGKGYFVTSAHVVEGGRSILLLGDEKVQGFAREEAVVVGKDQQFDLAVLRARPARAALDWADEPPRVGEAVFAIGNPFGQAPGSLSRGVASGLDRMVDGPNGVLVGMLQTDAALNGGNSGGPLLNASGRVVGVNTAILSPSGSSAGVGFAVPSRIARRITEALRRSGRIEHPSLGVTGSDDGPAVLVRVLPGGAASRAGLRDGDLVVEAAGRQIETFRELSAVVASQLPGSTLELDIRRGDEEQAVRVELPAGR